MYHPRRLSVILLLAAACAPALQPLPPMAPLPLPVAESPPSTDLRSGPDPSRGAEFEVLLARGLMVPVAGISSSQIADSYDAPRDGGRRHEALDIFAPRNAPVLAADDGVILRIGSNTLGGNVIWATDAARRFTYYYAHLDHYARGLREGQHVARGDLLAYVGTTGNAPADTPHLHFQAMRILENRRFNHGVPFNPKPFFTTPGVAR